jgi:hypothetical protein
LGTAKAWVEKRQKMNVEEKLRNLKSLDQSILDDSLDEPEEQDENGPQVQTQ